MLRDDHTDIKRRVPSIERHGFGIEYFEHYVNLSFTPHSPEGVVLISFIVRGQGRHVIEGSEQAAHAGSIGITHYGQEHDILTSPEGMDVYNIYVDLEHHPLPALPAPLDDVLHVILPLHPAFQDRMNRAVHLEIAGAQALAHLVERLRQEMLHPRVGGGTVLRDGFRIFLIECCRAALDNGIRPSRPSTGEIPEWVEQIRRHIDRHFTESLALADFTRLTGLSEGYLCRRFKRHTGKTIFEYLIARRMQAAMLRLRSSNEKVLRIALECGFSDLAFFNRKFKRMVGVSPTTYRKGISSGNGTLSGTGAQG